ncbi:hypothetical protein QTI33_07495 [Variovorax sp. J22P271]|uniref:hypothetical protein n=1 Tax=Variovorax davisae TaxID=3053515 RepID=UPI002576067D|nr:hypothetical protein [Variovorax sp. J22P271]MDM0031988.1 hypothetical protein [Variovorax sp. J22P271]
MRHHYALILFSLLLSNGHAFAQSTVGELIDGGGHQMDQAELISLLSGKTWQTGMRGEPVRTQYATDGKFTQTVRLGTGSAFGGQNVGHFGDWVVDESGQECQVRKDLRGGGAKRCRYWFAIGGMYFTVDDDPKDRASKLHKRTAAE